MSRNRFWKHPSDSSLYYLILIRSSLYPHAASTQTSLQSLALGGLGWKRCLHGPHGHWAKLPVDPPHSPRWLRQNSGRHPSCCAVCDWAEADEAEAKVGVLLLSWLLHQEQMDLICFRETAGGYDSCAFPKSNLVQIFLEKICPYAKALS